jgi:hypothetical protein
MKNILIPTCLEPDTVGAVASAIKHAAGNCTIVLMLFSEAPDAYSATEYLSRITPKESYFNNLTLKRCRTYIAEAPHCNLQVHHQYGLSKPLMRNLLEHKKIDLIIIPESVKNSTNKLYAYCSKLLLSSKYPILLPGLVAGRNRFNNALYLEQEGCTICAKEVEQLVNQKFPYRIVSHAQVTETENPDDLRPLLAEAIFKNDIDLVIETRNATRKSRSASAEEGYDKILGLPVLSLYEEIV